MNVNDYAPGSPQGVRQIASRIGETGNAAFEAKREMEAINGVCGDVKWEGGARNSFSDYALDLPADLGRMASSYTAVSDALNTYAWELEDIRNQVDQALARYQVAESRKKQADGEVSRAASRLAQLRLQLRSARVNEAWTKGQYELTSLVNYDAGLHDQYLRARNWRNHLESEETTVEQEHIRHRATADSAGADMSSVAGNLVELRKQRRQAEVRCQHRIDAALEGELKNRSWLQKYGDAVEGMKKAVLDKDFGDFVFHLREYLITEHEVFKNLSQLFLVIAVIAFAVALVAMPLAAPAVLAVLVLTMKAAAAAEKALLSGILITGAFLCATGHKHPRTGRQSVTTQDVGSDAVDLALVVGQGKFYTKEFGDLGELIPTYTQKEFQKEVTDLPNSWASVGGAMKQGMSNVVSPLTTPRFRIKESWDGRRPVNGPVFAN